MHFEKRTARNQKYRKFLHSRQQNLMLLGVFVFVISIVCGCSNQKEQESDGSLQKITVGIDKFEPYSYLDMDGNYTGVDIEIASKVFHELGYEPDFKFITWSEKHTCLADGTIDCIWSCYSMNDRENDYQWAGPYLYSRQVIAVASDSDIQTFDDLLGKNVGVQISIVCGCSNQKEQESDGSLQKITVGIDKFEPYSYLDMDGNYTGVDIEIASKVFHELGYEPDFKFITWSEKHTCLADGTIDCIWSCYSMNDRENDYQWAGPYLYSRQVIAVASDSDIQTFDDLLGKNVGVQDTTRAAELFFHTIDSALPEVKQVNCFATTEDMFAALRKGYVDAIAGHEALLNEFIINGKGKYRLLDESPYISKIGIAFQKGTHEELTQKINGLIKEMSEDGTIGSIAEKYGLDAEKVVIRGGSDEK